MAMGGANKGSLRICEKGHRFYKSSDCPTCPTCEEEKKPKDGFLSSLPAPARRALENAGLNTIKKISGKTAKELLSLHGFGPGSIPIVEKALKQEKLKLKLKE